MISIPELNEVQTEQLWASDDIDACIIEAKRILHDMQMTVIDQDAEESQILVCYFDHLDCEFGQMV